MPYNRANHIYSLQCILQALSFPLLLNISACSCNQETITPVATISMEIPTTQLVGEEKEIKVHFKLGDLTLLEGHQFRITVIEQKKADAKAAIAENQITYKNATGTLRAFSNTYTGALSEFITPNGLGSGKKPQVDFNVVPADQVMKLKLEFDLLQSKDNNEVHILQSIPVEWMIQEIVFAVVTDEKGTFLTLQSLKEDIKDPKKTILNIKSVVDNVFFLVNGKKTEVADLAQLLPHQQVLHKDQVSPRIPLIVKGSSKNKQLDPPIFSVLISQPDSTSPSLKVTPPDHPEIIKAKVSQLNKLRKEEQVNEKKLHELQDEQKIIKKGRQKVNEKLRKEEKQLKKIKKQVIKELEEQKDRELKGKGKKEQKAIQEKYEQQEKAILALDDQVINEQLQYVKGLWNGYAHNTCSIALKDAKNESFYKGQQAGLKISFGSAGAESAIGAALISGGVFTMLFTAGFSLPLSIAVIILGVILVAHGVFAGTRAQHNYLQGEEFRKGRRVEE